MTISNTVGQGRRAVRPTHLEFVMLLLKFYMAFAKPRSIAGESLLTIFDIDLSAHAILNVESKQTLWLTVIRVLSAKFLML